MNNAFETQGSILLAQAVYPSLQRWVDGFFIAKRSQRIAANTIEFFRKRLAHFVACCERRTRRIARWTGQMPSSSPNLDRIVVA
ncbi:MAG: hypothetical protein HY679_11045 [Chloroflexi bacterium]|nr:hypothetical protein [Chloroflexota bacterium]